MEEAATYMLLFWAPRALFAQGPRSPEAARESGERWHAWSDALREAGHLAGGRQLQPRGVSLTGEEAKEGTMGESYEVGGYFLVEATSIEHATELARGCPLLRAGGTVEVRPLMVARS